MANRGYDDMNNNAKAGKGLLATLILGGLGLAAVSSSSKKDDEERKNKKAALERELQNVRYQLSQYKGNLIREAWYDSEIKALEEKERNLIRQINSL